MKTPPRQANIRTPKQKARQLGDRGREKAARDKFQVRKSRSRKRICGCRMNSIEMPMMLPDKRGTLALIWQISGYAVKKKKKRHNCRSHRGAGSSFCFLPAAAPPVFSGLSLALFPPLRYISRRLFFMGFAVCLNTNTWEGALTRRGLCANLTTKLD